MADFSSPYSSLLPSIPDDQTLPQFMFSYKHQTLNRPERPAAVPCIIQDHTGKKVYWEELQQRVKYLAVGLKSRFNLEDEDTVCIFSPNHVDYPIAIWAVHMLGGVVSPSNPAYTAEEFLHQIDVVKPALILTHSDCLKTISSSLRSSSVPKTHVALFEPGSASIPCLEQLIEVGRSKVQEFIPKAFGPGEGKIKKAFVCFSSGTTGKPKAIAISHYNVISNVLQTMVHWQCNDPKKPSTTMPVGSVIMGVLPFFHIYGLVVSVHFALFAGLTLLVVPKFNFVPFLKSIVSHKVTHLLVVPPQVVLLCKHPAVKDYDLSHLRAILSGAAPLSTELLNMLGTMLPNTRITQGYGATEATGTISACHDSQWTNVPGSSGQLLAGMSARVVKADGALAAAGELGELLLAGPNIALGYTNDEKATRETFVDGWLRTGDEVFLDKDCNIHIVDRLKELIKVKGFQVAPAELEGHLLDHPDVADACVVGIPDDFSGEVPLAFIVLKDAPRQKAEASESEAQLVRKSISRHVEVAKSRYKWLAGGVRFIEVIPKSPSGKILRRLLRDSGRVSPDSSNAKSSL